MQRKRFQIRLERQQWQRIRLPVQEMQETGAQFLDREDFLEQKMTTHRKIPLTEEPGRLQSKESQSLT